MDILLLEDKLKHIQILRVYLSKNQLESAMPNQKYLGVLPSKELVERYIEKVQKQRKESV